MNRRVNVERFIEMEQIVMEIEKFLDAMSVPRVVRFSSAPAVERADLPARVKWAINLLGGMAEGRDNA